MIKLKEYLNQQNIKFYIHTLKHEKPVHQVIKGLPLLEDYEKIIASEITKKGLKCMTVLLIETNILE